MEATGDERDYLSGQFDNVNQCMNNVAGYLYKENTGNKLSLIGYL